MSGLKLLSLHESLRDMRLPRRVEGREFSRGFMAFEKKMGRPKSV